MKAKETKLKESLKETVKNVYDDDNIPEIDIRNVEPLPESERPRRDGPGGQ